MYLNSTSVYSIRQRQLFRMSTKKCVTAMFLVALVTSSFIQKTCLSFFVSIYDLTVDFTNVIKYNVQRSLLTFSSLFRKISYIDIIRW